MISKESFIKKLRVLGKQYASKTILDPENHQDAVKSVISDYLQGAEDSYNIFRTYDILDYNCKGLLQKNLTISRWRLQLQQLSLVFLRIWRTTSGNRWGYLYQFKGDT